MSNSIVQINTSVTLAPRPNNYQSKGACISQGGTTLAAGDYALLTQAPDLTPLLAPPLTVSTIVWSGGVVTVTANAALPGSLINGDAFGTTLAGMAPVGYNGKHSATVTGVNSFTFPLALDPGAATTIGTFTPPSQAALVEMISTFFAQGPTQAVWVLELGPGDATSGPGELATWAQNNPGIFYIYLLPRQWDGTAGLISLQALFDNPNAMTYFFVTTTPGSYSSYTAAMKSLFTEVESPGKPDTEFTLAANFQHVLSYAPSSTNKMTPDSFAALFGVTPYPLPGNNVLLAQLKAAFVNYVDTGAEGGVSSTILKWGTTMDGQDFAWWYAADWVQLTCDLNAANAVIEQSQNRINPLVYNQNGIDRLQDVTVQTLTTGIGAGLLTGGVVQTTLDSVTFAKNLNDGVYAGQNVVNAIPFSTYVAANPADYGSKRYAGLTVVAIPQNGFTQIVFNVNITDLLTQ